MRPLSKAPLWYCFFARRCSRIPPSASASGGCGPHWHRRLGLSGCPRRRPPLCLHALCLCPSVPSQWPCGSPQPEAYQPLGLLSTRGASLSHWAHDSSVVPSFGPLVLREDVSLPRRQPGGLLVVAGLHCADEEQPSCWRLMGKSTMAVPAARWLCGSPLVFALLSGSGEAPVLAREVGRASAISAVHDHCRPCAPVPQ